MILIHKLHIKHMKNRSIHPLWAEIKHLPLSRLFPSSLLVETDRLHRLLTLLVRTQRRFLVQGLEVVNRGLEPLIRKLALAVEPAPNLLQVEILLIIRSLHHIPLYILDRNILLLSFPLIWQLLKFLNRHIVLLLLLPSLIPHVWDVTKILKRLKVLCLHLLLLKLLLLSIKSLLLIGNESLATHLWRKQMRCQTLSLLILHLWLLLWNHVLRMLNVIKLLELFNVWLNLILLNFGIYWRRLHQILKDRFQVWKVLG